MKILNTYLKSFIFTTLLLSITLTFAQEKLPTKLKTSLNAFSFNSPLSEGKMNIDDLLQFCAANDFEAVDITAYYFPGYPEVPSDEYLYNVKRKAYSLGLEISGTGVRNDFTNPDPEKRKESVQLVKNWIIAAKKMGIPVIRVFTGNSDTTGHSREEVLSYLVADMKECAEFGKQHGVIVGIQNHDDFVKTADETIEIIKRVNSDWFKMILDTGSYRSGDPYIQIEQSIPFAINWQIKEKIFVNGIEEDTDLTKLFNIIKKSGYRGYIPIETLGAGDPKIKVPKFFKEIRKQLYNYSFF